jgi:catechol 2,3-dioxygenase-like lactoylglutathione lyase family enzyme
MAIKDLLIGAHSIIYSTDPEADRAFFRDVLGLSNVDTGDGWLIFSLPPAELAVHPASKNNLHEFFFMVANIQEFVALLEGQGVRCSPILNLSWGDLTQMTLPGGGEVGVYEPRHARPDGA